MKTLVAALLLALALPAAAKELHGVNSPETLKVGDKELKLNGMGLRKKAIFKVYVASLYLENTTKDANAILAADSMRRVEMAMLRDLAKEKIIDAIKEGFEKSAGANMPKLQARLDKFVAGIRDLKEGEKLSITYAPGKGTSIQTADGKDLEPIEGKDFADSLFSVWLGKEPVSEGLKNGMLGIED
ncbi:MAG: chalcone isomerase family protein [Deltaproteobacteria bacterium]|nr:chalcone isomerase family protein [Deltaproteobacteria bacterium]